MNETVRIEVGYVLRKFPVLSETFVLNEILALEERGVPVHIFSLERPNDPRFHENLSRLKACVTYLPQSIFARSLWIHNFRAAQRFGKRYFLTGLYALTRPGLGLFLRFLQSAYFANHAHRLRLTHLHSHFANRPTTVAYFVFRMTGIPYSFTAHAADIFRKRVRTRSLAQKIRNARFVVAISEFNRNYLEKLAGNHTAKIVRIYNGIDLNLFVSEGTAPKERFTLLCVSRLVEKKGLSILVTACSLLRDRGIDFQAWIVGSGELQWMLQDQIGLHHLENHVFLLGPQPQREVLERYRSSHLYVLPCIVGSDGNREGLPVSIIEALACGLPVITTPVTGIPEVIKNEHNGLLIAPGDPQALCNAIESLHSDSELYDRMRLNARPSVEAVFDLRRSAERLHSLLEQGVT